MNGLNTRLKRLEQVADPDGTAIVDGVRMDRAQMLAHFRQRTIAEDDRRRATGRPQQSWRNRPEIDANLMGDPWDQIRAARKRVAAAAAQEEAE